MGKSHWGVGGYAIENWYGVATHARTPPEILLRLNQLLVRALKAPDVQGRIAQEGTNVIGNNAAEFRGTIDSGVRRWHAVAKEAGIKGE